jgi:dihydroxy-acid dehydratase
VVPEAQEGGAIALVKDGDIVTLDAVNNRIEVDLTDDELAERRAAWVAPPLKATRGTLFKYIRYVQNASKGCVTDE